MFYTEFFLPDSILTGLNPLEDLPEKYSAEQAMLDDAPLSQKFASAMAEEGIFVTGFYYPVVPAGQARIRVQLSAAHTQHQLDRAIDAFIKVANTFFILNDFQVLAHFDECIYRAFELVLRVCGA